jgi:rubredoxin
MYKKGVAVEIQFSPDRLNDGASDPNWIDLTREEAQALYQTLQSQLQGGTDAPLIVSVAGTGGGMPEQINIVEVASDTGACAEGASNDFKQWVCVICRWIYDESAGLPEEGIAPGTRWADLPEDWRCPLCDVGKEDFAVVEF